jgi:hypothetical protein
VQHRDQHLHGVVPWKGKNGKRDVGVMVRRWFACVDREEER